MDSLLKYIKMSSAAAHISRIELENFKAFSHFSLHLQERNILLGPNNAGKSTIIGALRALDSGIRTAHSRAPSEIFIGEERHVGWRVPENSIPMSLENVHTNYSSEHSVVKFFLDNRNQVRLIFPAEGGCVLIPDVRGDYVYTASAFKKHFPIALSTVPVLGPLEHREALRE